MKISETFAETNETIVRDMTEEELLQRQKDIEEQAQLKAKEEKVAAEAAAKKATAEAKLAALGLTADDLKALGL